MFKSFIKSKIRENIALLTEITVNDAWNKIYSDKAKFPILDGNEEFFNTLNSLYTDNNNFNKGVFTWLYNLRKRGQLKDEDFYKAKEYLRLFTKFYNKIPKENRDINKYKSLGDLYVLLKDFAENEDSQATSKTQELKQIKEKEVKKVFEDDEWLVMIPLTERASCMIGKGTQWCTAADRGNNLFDSYNKQGHLYVVVNKSNNEKYQLHFETNSLMDENDRPISASYFFEYVAEYGGLEDFFKKEIPTLWNFVLETSYEDYSGYSELFNQALDKCLDEEVLQKVLNHLRSEYDEEAIYLGFIYETDKENIDQYDIEHLMERGLDSEQLDRIIDHLIEIGFDFNDVESVGDGYKNYAIGKEQLEKYKLETNNTYQIGDKSLTINRVLFSDDEPKFEITMDKHKGSVNLEQLLNYLHQGQLFENKKNIKKVLRGI